MFPFRARSRSAQRTLRHPVYSPRVECLEDRLLLTGGLDFRDLGSLRFEAQQFTTTGSDISVTGGTVTVGFAPTTGENFLGLIDINLNTRGQLEFDQASSPQTFSVTNGSMDSIVQNGILPIWDSAGFTTPVKIDVSQLLSVNGFTFPAGSSQPIEVAKVQFALTSLGLKNPDGGATSDAQVLMQGSLNLPVIGKALSIKVDGGNYVIADTMGLQLTGVTADVHLPPTGSTGGIKGFNVVGDVGVTYTPSTVGGHDIFEVAGGVTVSTDPQGSNQNSVLQNVAAKMDLEVDNGQLDKLGFSVGGEFKILSLDVKADPANPISFLYDASQDSYTVSGGLDVNFEGNAIAVNLGFANNPISPGIVVTEGTLETFNATINGDLHLFGADLTTNGNGLNFSYDAAQDQFEMFGGLTLNLPGVAGKQTSISAQMGTSDDPGLIIQDGNLKQLNMGVSGQFNVGGLTVAVGTTGNPVDVFWTRDSTGADVLAISGTLSIQNLWQVSVTLGAPNDPKNSGLIIKDGQFQLNNFKFDLENFGVGPLTIKTLIVTYASTGNGDYTVSGTLDVLLPGGIDVAGSLKVVNGQVEDVGLSLNDPTGIPVGDTGLFVTFVSAQVQNIEDPVNIVVTGTIGLNYGEQFSLLGRSVSIFRAEGSFTVDRNELVLQGSAWIGAFQTGASSPYAGLLGDGTATLTLEWATKHYEIDVNIGMYDGAFQLGGSLSFDNSGNLLLTATATINVPSAIPVIGGKQLGGASFVFEYHPDDIGSSFVAAWVEVDVIKTEEIGFKFDLNKNLSVIGGDDIDAIKADVNGQKSSDGATFTYFSTYTVPAGASSAILSVNWPDNVAPPTVSITPDNGPAIAQKDFDAATNGISLVQAQSTSKSDVVNIVGSATNPNQALTATTYTLTLTSSVRFSSAPVFAGTFQYPQPTIALQDLVSPGVSNSLSVPLQGTVDTAFAKQTTLSLYADIDNQGYNGILIAKDIPITVDASGNFTTSANWDLTGLLPLPQYAYAVLNDGKNVPVYSAYSQVAVTPDPPISGTVSDPKHNAALAGFTVFLDVNGDGIYEPSDPHTTTGPTGFYAFYNNMNGVSLTAGTNYQVGVVIPDETPAAYQIDAGSSLLQSFTYDPENSAVINFGVDELAAIEGTVFNDLTQGGAGMSGVLVYIDANLNGQFDPGEQSTVTNAAGHYALQGLVPGEFYPVAVQLPTGYYATSAVSQNVFMSNDPFDVVTGKDFHILPFSTVSGTLLDSAGNPLGGRTVQLWNADIHDRVLLGTQITAADGTYTFSNVPAGSYTVDQIVPDGSRQVAPFSSSMQFEPQPLVTGTGGTPNSVTTADLNNDGLMDFAYTVPGDDFVFIGYAQSRGGTKLMKVELPFSNPVAVVALNLPNTKGPSLAVVSGNGQVTALLNEGATGGSVNFTVTQTYWNLGQGRTPLSVAKGDFTGNGFDDLAVTFDHGPENAGVALLMSQGTEVRITALPFGFATPNQAGIAVGDIADNGFDDLLINGEINPGGGAVLTILRNDGTGHFLPPDEQTMPIPIAIPFAGGGVAAITDFNNDGLLDIVGTDAGDALVRMALGLDGINYQPNLVANVNSPNPAITGLIAADFDGDLKPDMVAILAPSPNTFLNGGALVAWSNSGTAPYFDFFAPLSFGAGFLAGPTDMVGADMNGDGLLDLVIADSINGGSIVQMTNTSSINQQIPVTVTPGQTISGIDFTDSQTGSVTGVVFQDADRNGSQGVADSGQAGVTVYLDMNHNGTFDPSEPSTTTTASGTYSFTGLADGTYQVGIVPQSGQVLTSLTTLTSVAVMNGSASPVDFGTAPALLQPVADQTAQPGNLVSFQVMRTTVDAGQQLIYRLDSGAPDGAAIDPITGQFTWTPTWDQAGASYAVTVHIDNPFNTAEQQAETFTITVSGSQLVSFVRGLYMDVLGRPAEAAGLDFWTNLLNTDTSRTFVAAAFWTSPEHLGAEVEQLYANYLHRAASATERDTWVGVLQAGSSLTDVATRLLLSAEYQAAHGSDNSFLSALYSDALARPADSAGLTFWQQQSGSGLSRTDIAQDFLNSQEARIKLVDNFYAEFLGRAADSAGQAAWLGQIESGVSPDSVAEQFLGSDEYFARN